MVQVPELTPEDSAALLQHLKYRIDEYYRQLTAPHVLMRPTLSMTGGRWCALYGDSSIFSAVGYGDSAEAAMKDFDFKWRCAEEAKRVAAMFGNSEVPMAKPIVLGQLWDGGPEI